MDSEGPEGEADGERATGEVRCGREVREEGKRGSNTAEDKKTEKNTAGAEAQREQFGKLRARHGGCRGQSGGKALPLRHRRDVIGRCLTSKGNEAWQSRFRLRRNNLFDIAGEVLCFAAFQGLGCAAHNNNKASSFRHALGTCHYYHSIFWRAVAAEKRATISTAAGRCEGSMGDAMHCGLTPIRLLLPTFAISSALSCILHTTAPDAVGPSETL